MQLGLVDLLILSCMLGSIIGDIIGSRFEFDNVKSKDFELLSDECSFTDDTICTIAVADAVLNGKGYRESVHGWCRKYPHPMGGYGGSFARWVESENPRPYQSFGNGAAMRVSPIGLYYASPEIVRKEARKSAEITHDHPEGIKGAEATALLTYDALHGASMKELRATAESYYDLNFTIDEIRPTYRFNETCQDTVPQALQAFFEAKSFEDAIRTAVSVGGDSDTLAAITGGIAEAYFGVPEDMKVKAESYLDARLLKILKEFNRTR